jgi:hypothetical protein
VCKPNSRVCRCGGRLGRLLCAYSIDDPMSDRGARSAKCQHMAQWLNQASIMVSSIHDFLFASYMIAAQSRLITYALCVLRPRMIVNLVLLLLPSPYRPRQSARASSSPHIHTHSPQEDPGGKNRCGSPSTRVRPPFTTRPAACKAPWASDASVRRLETISRMPCPRQHHHAGYTQPRQHETGTGGRRGHDAPAHPGHSSRRGSRRRRWEARRRSFSPATRPT